MTATPAVGSVCGGRQKQPSSSLSKKQIVLNGFLLPWPCSSLPLPFHSPALTLIRPFLAFFRSVVFKQPFCLHCVQLRPVVPAAALRARPCFLGLLQCPPGLPCQPGRSGPVTLGLPFLVMTFHFFPFLSSLPAGSSVETLNPLSRVPHRFLLSCLYAP